MLYIVTTSEFQPRHLELLRIKEQEPDQVATRQNLAIIRQSIIIIERNKHVLRLHTSSELQRSALFCIADKYLSAFSPYLFNQTV